MEKRKVTVSVGGQACSFYSDDPEEYVSALAQKANEALRQTAAFSRSSARTNAALALLLLSDEVLRQERKDRAPETEQKGRLPGTEPKGGRKANMKPAAEDKGQVSVWDLLDEPAR